MAIAGPAPRPVAPALFDLVRTPGTFHNQICMIFLGNNSSGVNEGLREALNEEQTPEQERFFRAALKSDAARVRLEALARDGYDVFHPIVGGETKTLFGEKVETAKFDQVQPTERTWARAMQRAGSIALSVLAFPLLFYKPFRQEYGSFGWTGSCESQEIAVPKELSPEESAESQVLIDTGRRYDPNDSESIKRYVHNAGTKPSMYLGHEFFIDNEAASRDGVSSFLFAPNGDWSKSFSVVMYNPKNGQSIGDTDEIHRAIRAYCEQYRTMSDGLNPFIERSIDSYLAQNPIAPDQNEAAERRNLRNSLGRMFSLVVIDPDSGKTRVYHRSAVNDPTKALRSFEPNPIAGFLQQFSPKGLVIEWDEHLKERVKSVYEGQKDRKFTDERPNKRARLQDRLRDLEGQLPEEPPLPIPPLEQPLQHAGPPPARPFLPPIDDDIHGLAPAALGQLFHPRAVGPEEAPDPFIRQRVHELPDDDDPPAAGHLDPEAVLPQPPVEPPPAEHLDPEAVPPQPPVEPPPAEHLDPEAVPPLPQDRQFLPEGELEHEALLPNQIEARRWMTEAATRVERAQILKDQARARKETTENFINTLRPELSEIEKESFRSQLDETQHFIDAAITEAERALQAAMWATESDCSPHTLDVARDLSTSGAKHIRELRIIEEGVRDLYQRIDDPKGKGPVPR